MTFKKQGAINPLLQAMRLFHYMVGITAPKPEHERKVLLLWIAIVIMLLGVGTAFAFFIVARIIK